MWFVLAAIFTRLVSGDPWQWCFAVVFCGGVDELPLAWSIPQQNYCIDGEHGGWSFCES